MSPPVKSAMTAEEWADWRHRASIACQDNTMMAHEMTERVVDDHGSLAGAAWLLDHADGCFTWADVDRLRDMLPMPTPTLGSMDAQIARLNDLADRIAALLPPREP